MIQPARRHLVFTDVKAIAAIHFLKFAFGIHRRHVYWKIRQRHLRLKYLLQTVPAQVFRAETVKVKMIFFVIQRRKKRNSLDVIPVIMRYEDVRLRRLLRVGRSPAAAQHPQSSPAVQNDL
jgi:hypothetical protein